MESTAAWSRNERIKSQSWLALFAVLGSVATGCGQDADSETTPMEHGSEPEGQRLFADRAELPNVDDVVSPLQPVPTYLSAEEVTALMAHHTLSMERQFPAASAQASTKAAASMFLNYPAGQDVPQTTITTVNEHLCYLHTFSGPIRGGTLMKVGLYPPPLGGIPVSIVVEKDPAPEMGVFCVARTAFTTPNGFLPTHNPYQYDYYYDDCNSGGGSLGYNGKHQSAVAGLGYDFSSGSDKIYITQSAGAAASTFGLQAAAPTCRTLGYFNSIHMRTDGGYTRFYGPNGAGTADQAGEFNYVVSNGQSLSVGIAPETNVCYFTYIGGNLRSTSEKASLIQVGPYGAYNLLMTSSGTGSLRAKVRCVTRTQ